MPVWIFEILGFQYPNSEEQFGFWADININQIALQPGLIEEIFPDISKFDNKTVYTVITPVKRSSNMIIFKIRKSF